jgi:hypothetical protein
MGCGCFLFIIFLIVVCCLAMTFCTVSTVAVVSEAVKVSADTNTPALQPPPPQIDTDKSNPAPENQTVTPAQTNDQSSAVPPTSPETVKPEIKDLNYYKYRGTIDTNFAKGWVIVDHEKIDGITAVTPAPNGIVDILYSNGNKNIPAKTLPQGFLDMWGITPKSLKAADSQ